MAKWDALLNEIAAEDHINTTRHNKCTTGVAGVYGDLTRAATLVSSEGGKLTLDPDTHCNGQAECAPRLS